MVYLNAPPRTHARALSASHGPRGVSPQRAAAQAAVGDTTRAFEAFAGQAAARG